MRLGLAVIALMLAGCAGYERAMTADDPVAPQDAVLYGRFFVNSPSALLAIDGHATMGISYSCEDGAVYTVRFSNSAPLQSVLIKPSRCSLTEVVFTDADGMVKGRQAANASVVKSFEVKAGEMFYLGDFTGEVTHSTTYDGWATHWKISDVSDNFGSTTRELVAQLPRLAQLTPVSISASKDEQ